MPILRQDLSPYGHSNQLIMPNSGLMGTFLKEDIQNLPIVAVNSAILMVKQGWR